MVKLAGIVLVFYLAAFVKTMPQQQEQQLPVAATAPINTCLANSTPISQRGDTNCVLNCANYANRNSMACTDILNIGNFCHCVEGYVFKQGAEGKCVRIADCGK
ncbi:hypothetical protein TYRP_017194 [Tyrophagus putrescentiae]|nr:hypothetical protein TYRP_017194 [Tyrophagus putrescentiae]